jgi:hypothetical protein
MNLAMRGASFIGRYRVAVMLLVVVATLAGTYFSLAIVQASPTVVGNVNVAWHDSRAMTSWSPVSDASGGYKVTLIRMSDKAVMQQVAVSSSQTVADMQPLFPGVSYRIAVQAVGSNGSVGAPAYSNVGQSVPLNKSAYNGFLDTENVADGAIDSNLWDVRLGQDNSPNQGGTFVNPQLHYHLEAGNMDGDQTFASMRARVPVSLANGRTATISGDVDLKGDFFNWFAVSLSPTIANGDHIIDQVDRTGAKQRTPQLELFDDENGLHLIYAAGDGSNAMEIGNPYKGGLHTNNVRDTLTWKVSRTHVTVLIDGQTAFDVSLPKPFTPTSAYLTLMAENYPGNTGGIHKPTAADAVMGAANMWHLDNWGFDAPSGVMPQVAVGYTSNCGAAPSVEDVMKPGHKMVSWTACGRLDNTNGYGWQSANGQSVSTTVNMPSSVSASSLASAKIVADVTGLNSASRITVSVNGGPFVATGAPIDRTSSVQEIGIPIDASLLHAGANKVTFRDSQSSYDTPQFSNIQIEAVTTKAYVTPALPAQPASLGTWTDSGLVNGANPAPTAPPVTIDGIPCTISINGADQQGTCSGTFIPNK